jgi:hypothetical protein
VFSCSLCWCAGVGRGWWCGAGFWLGALLGPEETGPVVHFFLLFFLSSLFLLLGVGGVWGVGVGVVFLVPVCSFARRVVVCGGGVGCFLSFV